MNKKYEVPEELANIMDEIGAYSNMRDIYIKLPFGFKKAVKCSMAMAKLSRKFWRGIYDIYPELKGRLTYMRDENVVVLHNEEEN